MSANWKILMLGLLLIACIGLGSEIFLSKPKNVAVIAGQRMEMECRTGSESKITAWYFLPSVNKGESPVTLVADIDSKIQFSENISPEFGVNFDANGSGMIYFNSTSTEDAGIYLCEAETGSNVVKFSAQLIVFESEPICETNLREHSKLSTDETIWMRCNVSYRGNWLPTVEWRQHNSNGGWRDYVAGTPVDHGLVETSFVNNNSVSSSLTVVVNSTMGGSCYSFNVFFNSHNRSIRTTDATNIPEFRFTWNSSTISIDSTTVIDVSFTKTTAKSGSTNRGQTSPDRESAVAVLSGLVVFLTAVILVVAVVWHCRRLKRRKSGNEPKIVDVAAASGSHNQSDIQANSITATSLTLTTQVQQRSQQQQYEILGLHGDETNTYTELTQGTVLNTGNTESPAVRPTSKEDNTENFEYSVIERSADEYEEVEALDAADSTKAYLELML